MRASSIFGPYLNRLKPAEVRVGEPRQPPPPPHRRGDEGGKITPSPYSATPTSAASTPTSAAAVIEELKLNATLSAQQQLALVAELRAKDALMITLQSKVLELSSVVATQGRSYTQLQGVFHDSEERSKAQAVNAAETVAAIREEAAKTAAAYASRAEALQGKAAAAERAAALHREAAVAATATIDSARVARRGAEAVAAEAIAAAEAASEAARAARTDAATRSRELQTELAKAVTRAAVLRAESSEARASSDALSASLGTERGLVAEACAELVTLRARVAGLETELSDATSTLLPLPPPFAAGGSVAEEDGDEGKEEGAGEVLPAAQSVSVLPRVSSFKSLSPNASGPALPLQPLWSAGLSLRSPGLIASSGSSDSSGSSSGSSSGGVGGGSRVIPVPSASQAPRSLRDLCAWYVTQLRRERAEHAAARKEERGRRGDAAAVAARLVSAGRSEAAAALGAAAEAHAAQLRSLTEQAAVQERETVVRAQTAVRASEARAAALEAALIQAQCSSDAATAAAAARPSISAAPPDEGRLAQWTAVAHEEGARLAASEARISVLQGQADAALKAVAEADAARAGAEARLAAAEASHASDACSLAEAESSLGALNREASALRADAADADTLRADNARLRSAIAAGEIAAAGAAADAAALAKAAAEAAAEAASAASADADWLRSAHSVTRASLTASEGQVARLMSALGSLHDEHAASYAAVQAAAGAALVEADARHSAEVAGLRDDVRASAASVIGATAVANHAALVEEHARAAVRTEALERDLAAAGERELSVRGELAATLVSLVEKIGARDAQAAAALAAAKLASEATLARAASEAMRCMGAMQASHAEQVDIISLRCAEAEAATDDLSRDLRATAKAGALADAAARSLRAELAVFRAEAGAAAEAAVRGRVVARADLATARQVILRLQDDGRNLHAAAGLVGVQLAEALARAVRSDAQAAGRKQQVLAAEAHARASEAALAEGVQWATAVADALHAHIAALRTSDGGGGARRTLGALESLYAAAGLGAAGSGPAYALKHQQARQQQQREEEEKEEGAAAAAPESRAARSSSIGGGGGGAGAGSSTLAAEGSEFSPLSTPRNPGSSPGPKAPSSSPPLRGAGPSAASLGKPLTRGSPDSPRGARRSPPQPEAPAAVHRQQRRTPRQTASDGRAPGSMGSASGGIQVSGGQTHGPAHLSPSVQLPVPLAVPEESDATQVGTVTGSAQAVTIVDAAARTGVADSMHRDTDLMSIVAASGSTAGTADDVSSVTGTTGNHSADSDPAAAAATTRAAEVGVITVSGSLSGSQGRLTGRQGSGRRVRFATETQAGASQDPGATRAAAGASELAVMRRPATLAGSPLPTPGIGVAEPKSYLYVSPPSPWGAASPGASSSQKQSARARHLALARLHSPLSLGPALHWLGGGSTSPRRG